MKVMIWIKNHNCDRNKSDLPQSEKEVDKTDIEKFENNTKLKIIEVSAIENKNVNECMHDSFT